MGRPRPFVSPVALEMLLRYPWPGNVRELQNEVQRCLVMAAGGTAHPRGIPVPQDQSGRGDVLPSLAPVRRRQGRFREAVPQGGPGPLPLSPDPDGGRDRPDPAGPLQAAQKARHRGRGRPPLSHRSLERVPGNGRSAFNDGARCATFAAWPTRRMTAMSIRSSAPAASATLWIDGQTRAVLRSEKAQKAEGLARRPPGQGAQAAGRVRPQVRRHVRAPEGKALQGRRALQAGARKGRKGRGGRRELGRGRSIVSCPPGSRRPAPAATSSTP